VDEQPEGKNVYAWATHSLSKDYFGRSICERADAHIHRASRTSRGTEIDEERVRIA
jgi:hypothetical protein